MPITSESSILTEDDQDSVGKLILASQSMRAQRVMTLPFNLTCYEAHCDVTNSKHESTQEINVDESL